MSYRKRSKSLTSKLLNLLLPEKFYFAFKGYCPCCEQNVDFVAYNDWLRDFFLCSVCGSLPRERALIVVIEKYYPQWKSLAIHESSPVDRGASLKLRKNCKNYISSQYYPNEVPGKIKDSHRNENLEKQTFKDQSFDLVITQDVMEHIYDPDRAFAEIARTLKPGGAHIFTVPLINKHKTTQVWAILEGDKPKFLHTPEYHGNPVDPNGSPVTMHWGFDIVDHIYKASKMHTVIEHLDDLDLGIRAEYIEVLISTKQD